MGIFDNLKDLILGDDTLDSTAGVSTDRTLEDKTLTGGTSKQTENSNVRSEAAERAAAQETTNQTTTATTNVASQQNQKTTGSQTTAEKQTSLDAQTQNTLKMLLGNVADSPAAGTGAFNSASAIIQQLLGGSASGEVNNSIAADVAAAKLNFSENTLPGLNLFSQDTGSTLNSASDLLKAQEERKLATQLAQIQATGALEGKKLDINSLIAGLSGATGVGSAESGAALNATQQAALLANVLKGSEVTQTGQTNTLQDLINNLTSTQTQTSSTNLTSNKTSQSDELQLQAILNTTAAEETAARVQNIKELGNQLTSGTQQKDNSLLPAIAAILGRK